MALYKDVKGRPLRPPPSSRPPSRPVVAACAAATATPPAAATRAAAAVAAAAYPRRHLHVKCRNSLALSRRSSFPRNAASVTHIALQHFAGFVTICHFGLCNVCQSLGTPFLQRCAGCATLCQGWEPFYGNDCPRIGFP